MKIALLKKRKKIFSKKDASHLKIARHSKIQKQDTEKRKRKTKNEKKLNSSKIYFFTFTFLYRKIYILLEKIFGKT